MSDNMNTTDMQAVKDFKKAVTAAKNRRDMFWRSQAPELAAMLEDALEEFKKAGLDEKQSAAMLALVILLPVQLKKLYLVQRLKKVRLSMP